MVGENISLNDWWPWYNRIASIFGYDKTKDQRAADILSALLTKKAINLNEFRALVADRSVLVFGAGPSLEENLRKVSAEGILERCVIFSADGATTALLRIVKATPNVVITDLDGTIRDLLLADKLGATMVIHGHGDNIDQLKRHVPKFVRAFGTTQVEPRSDVYNFGGFTDGDRAVFLAVAMGARLIALAGMDLGNVIGRYSKTYVSSVEVKKLKLKICRELLEWLASRTAIKLFNVTERGENIRGFKNITASSLQKLI